jgi:hypothetical protein
LASRPAAAAPARALPDAEGLGSLAAIVLGVAALGIWLVTVERSNFAHIGQLGLVSILGPTYFLGLAVAVAALCLALVQPTLREWRVAGLVGVLVVYVFGTACAVEPTASLATSWIHAGFVQYILQHGHPLNNYDAEFSWPGAFSFGALLVSFMGQANALDLLRWFPLAIELAYLAPLLAIARRSGVNRRAGWLGVAIFYGTNWIYQDYFSPQALNLLFFLTIVAVVLWVWKPTPLAAPPPRGTVARALASRRSLSFARIRGKEARSDLPPRTILGILAVITLVMIASAVSHQLTPYAIFLALAACLLTRRLARPELVAIMLLLAVGWLSLGASNYWLGHLSDIFGSFGQLFGTFGQNVSSRVTGSASHRMVVDVRILLTAALFGGAALGAMRRATDSRTLEVLAISQFALLGAQNYGGEGLLRVALLTGPFASLLAASAILPTRVGALPPIIDDELRWRHRRVRIPWPSGRVTVGVCATVVLFGFATVTTVVRGGNDAYESFSTGEVDAANYIYAHAVPLDLIGIVSPYAPLGQRDVGSVGIYVVSETANIPRLSVVGANLVHHRPTFVDLGAAQEAWGVILAGYPPGWETTVEHYLLAHGYKVAARWSTATVLRLT